jgi:hypothetical protein
MLRSTWEAQFKDPKVVVAIDRLAPSAPDIHVESHCVLQLPKRVNHEPSPFSIPNKTSLVILDLCLSPIPPFPRSICTALSFGLEDVMQVLPNGKDPTKGHNYNQDQSVSRTTAEEGLSPQLSRRIGTYPKRRTFPALFRSTTLQITPCTRR